MAEHGDDTDLEHINLRAFPYEKVRQSGQNTIDLVFLV